MYEFQLYQPPDEAFPNELIIQSVSYPVNSDYRVILRALKVQERTDVSQIARNIKTIELFYEDKYPQDNPLLYFNAFVSRCKQSEPDGSPPIMDYFHDADVIYTSVKTQYGIDLIRVDFLHWYEFIMYVQGLNENTPLAERIRIRAMKLEGLTGEDLVKAQRAKKRAALPHEVAEMEQLAMMHKFGM